ncbi:ABC transporter substrate-binding protein [Rhizobiaceae bacterium BDR2-2]|uniref:ABC transporter substrate-binding protein n=1 Tax=Ectorhizobium quercum TaxID=2965071 RepID=A0AAE3N060_9HYPH|nr:ABC transporter substrate-binding protein [Ectorhizobium quercum]MCX8997486.1 ABC transporter substrate-binding protein [Ectorhizobium quercum]
MFSLSRRVLFRGAGALLAATALSSGALSAGAAFAGSASPQSGGTLNFLAAVQPPALIPFSPDYSRSIGPKVVEGLLRYDFDLTPKPALATAWDVSDDGLTYTFTLREGVKWHDGKPFTAADAAFSIQLLKEIHPRGRATFANVSATDTPDDHTLILRLSQPAPYLLNALVSSESPIVARHIYEGTDPKTNPANNAPVGTGPFRFVELVHGSHLILERNPDYWDAGKPYLDRIIFRFISDQGARAVALETGEADVASGTLVPLSEVERIKGFPHIAIDSRGSIFDAGVKRLEFNLDDPYFKDIRVRQAVAHAIDKTVVHNVIWYGFGEIVSGPISPELVPFRADDLPDYDFDPAKSEKLLDEAGYPRGQGGIRFRVVHDFRPATEGDRRTADYVKQALAKVGIEVDVRVQDFATYVKRVYTDRDFSFTTNSMTNTFDPTVGVQRLYWSKNFKPGVPFSNGSHYANPQVDALLEAAAVEVDPVRRKQLWTDVQRQVIADLPDLNLLTDFQFSFINRRVVDAIVDAAGISGDFASTWIKA